MAKHRINAVSKSNIARAALGVTVIASALGANAMTANADTATGVAAATAAKHPATAIAAHKAGAADNDRTETKINVTASQVLAMAKAQVGTSENSYGGGTKFQQWYAGSQRAGETVARDGGSRSAYLNAAWCSMFVSWVGEQTGARPQVGWDAYTVAHAKWFAANDRFGTVAKPGAVVFFAWDGGKSLSDIQHVGFVVKDNQNGTISTIEGNTGNGKVEERVRPKSQVVGYGYPQYAG
ncbi:CHAP domain-containing protein [Nonomuraea sp. PA05]|uniref:CHAP domain-containing protein n=1 Tax=Nonomuraea sp. PA05 TaxID=2604466 RepID=UPI0011DA8908|nr:CHAP domain-containing protein [Nonomuraea sp. PA05]TYB53201.1 CHAP domain-containing protein [Nonomuraea sp. PA05]